MCNFIFIVRYKFRRISISFHVKLIHIFLDEFDCVLRLIQVDTYLTSLFKMKLRKNEEKQNPQSQWNARCFVFNTIHRKKKLAQNNVNHLALYARK